VSQLSFISAGVNYFQGMIFTFPLQPNNVKAPLRSEPTSHHSMGMLLGRSLGEAKAVLLGQR